MNTDISSSGEPFALGMLTIDMVHQYAYCPRRMQLMYVDGRWEDNLHTEQGKSVHARVDGTEDPLPSSDGGSGEDDVPRIARSVSLVSEALGLAGKLDLLDEGRRLAFARAFVSAKIQNQRTFLRRNAKSPVPDSLAGALSEMKELSGRVPSGKSAEELMGLEGRAAALYFKHWGALVGDEALAAVFSPRDRNRRPPKDPINALLSFGYALLAKEASVALLSEGLDPFWGFLHRPRHGKPSLALDLMEEFRPLIVDSAVLTAVNTRMVGAGDFVVCSAGCAMKDSGRKAFIRAFELRMDQMATHPLFDYRCSWRTMVRVQAKLLAKVLRGELPAYAGITTR
jgi:CRISPR-associated endonuclease Cas1